VTAIFNHFELRLVNPDFDSKLNEIILELEPIRSMRLGGSTHPAIFFELKRVFHLLESLGSARIEGNNTTIADYVEAKLDNTIAENEKLMEIDNVGLAMNFIEENIDENTPITRAMLFEIHKITVNNLTPAPKGEGDITPGEFRARNVKINKSNHLPPEFIQVAGYVDELLEFINRKDRSIYDLLKTAIAHHRFTWIHPFNNGNGRVVRLLTYAQLIKSGFKVKEGRLLNPTAVFCADRDEYYRMLSIADSGSDEGILEWCEYVLSGLLEELKKIDLLTNHEYLAKNLLIPAIDYCLERTSITATEGKILKRSVELIEIQAGDIKELIKGKTPEARTRQLAKMKSNNLIKAIRPKARKYVISFSNNYLLRGIIHALRKQGLIAVD